MIDLRNKGLPETIEVDGESFLLNTDFRTWIKFGEVIKDRRNSILDCLFVFKDMTLLEAFHLPDNVFVELLNFYSNPNATPKGNTSHGDVVIDYVLDGEYIVGSFMSAYGIDLTVCDMHWHLFKALFLSLPDDTKIKQIMQMRAWHKDSQQYDDICKQQKNEWALPTKTKKVDESIMEEINNEFYNS